MATEGRKQGGAMETEAMEERKGEGERGCQQDTAEGLMGHVVQHVSVWSWTSSTNQELRCSWDHIKQQDCKRVWIKNLSGPVFPGHMGTLMYVTKQPNTKVNVEQL